MDELFLHQKTMTHEDQRNQNGSIEVIDDDLDYLRIYEKLQIEQLNQRLYYF